jgi:CRP-like cAMP-binding protein
LFFFSQHIPSSHREPPKEIEEILAKEKDETVEVDLCTLVQGALVGDEEAMVMNLRRYSVIALEPVTVYEMRRIKFREVLKSAGGSRFMLLLFSYLSAV